MFNIGKSTKNAAFFTVLGQRCPMALCQELEKLFDNVDTENVTYWEKFGYKYLGMLSLFPWEKISEILKQQGISNVLYAESVLQLYYGEKIPQNKDIIGEIDAGIQSFLSDVEELKEQITLEIAISGIIYLADYVSSYDEKNIYQAVKKVIISGEEHFLPIIPRSKYSFGIVYPWPGTDTAETELLARTTKAAENIGFECVMLSDFGQVLDETQHETEEYVNAEKLMYVMTTHYESHKTIDGYYYHLLWNPPDIPLDTAYYEGKVLNNYLMNDDYLIYDFGGMSNHLKSMLIHKPRTLENASTFVGSFPKSAVMSPNLDDPKIFYCGMNWEKALGNNDRHAGLFELLDKTGNVKFYGPDVVESWGGIRPWEGYECYQYSIPFDGFSILKEINSCGICLAISSDAHRRAGAVTNRAYEACAAGAVIISDNNVFMEEYFGDSVLYVTYNKLNPQDTFQQIMEKYQWIVEHKEEALEMAKRSQKIFTEKFCMEKGILDVTKNHYGRFKTIEKDLFAQDDQKTVLVTCVLNTQDEGDIDELLQDRVRNVSEQYYGNIILGVACDVSMEVAVCEYAKKASANIAVVPMELFDEKGSRCVTDAQAIFVLQHKLPHDYYMNLREDELWFYDHVTTLVRTVEDSSGAMGAFAGMLSEDPKGIRRTYTYENLTYEKVYYMKHPNNLPMAGQFLFKAESEELIPEYMLGCVDGMEHALYAAILWIKGHKEIAFSKRMTCVWQYEHKNSAFTILDVDRQIRFIRGLVKFDLPSTGLGRGLYELENRRSRRDFMLTMPLMQSLSVRFWRKLSCHMNNKRGLGRIVYNKFRKKLAAYDELMEKLQED
ncbi:MAG: glycosyltransferase [bacterium]|nr:glycosyltransferase [bacterium]MCM1374852.1 glycosyltransferase [Muribaculum sp.]